MKTVRSFFVVLFVITTSLCELNAQPYCPRNEWGNQNVRRRSDVDTNNLHLSVFNFGMLGRTGSGQGVPFEWPKGTGRNYIALSAMFIGAEVIDDTERTIRIVDLPNYRTNQATGEPWVNQPVPEYLRPSPIEIARSDDPSTWPPVWVDKMNDPVDPGWPGSWNGLLGKNHLINGTELYYHYSDDSYSRYLFHPDTTNPNRHGLGLIVSERALQFTDPLLDDAVIIVSDITNVGSRPILRAGITLWVADFIGGDGDSQDDFPSFDLTRQLAQCNDRDGVSSNPAFIGQRVGTPTLVFIQTPENRGITNVQYVAAGAINFSQTADVFYWNEFMTPGRFVNPLLIGVGEYDLFVSTSYFSIPVCAPQRFTYAWVMATDSLDGKRKAEYLKSFVRSGFSMNSVSVSVVSPGSGSVVSGNVPIQWNTNVSRPSLRVDVLASSNFGDTWKAVATNEANDGSYLWNTATYPDGIFWKLRVVAYDSLGIGYSTMDSTFTINNPQQAVPQIRLDKSLSGGVYQGVLPVRWIAGDADGEQFSIELSYGLSVNQTPGYSIASGLSNTGVYNWNTEPARNSKSIFLRAKVYNTLSSHDSLNQPLEIRNPRYGISDTAFSQRHAVGTGTLRPVIVNPSQVTGHTYKIQFESATGSSRRRLDLFDESTGTLIHSVEYPNFRFAPWEIVRADGFAILFGNDSTMVDTNRTKWNHTDVKRTYFHLWNEMTEGFPEPADYVIEMGNVGIGRSDSAYLADLVFPPKDVNFRIWNSTTQSLAHFAFLEQDGNDGRFSANWSTDVIALLKQDSTSGWVPTWEIALMTGSGLRNPAPGDTFVAKLFKAFQPGDSYRFTAITGNLLDVKQNSQPREFTMGQNYPNPFNPSTTINVMLAIRSDITLTLYDVLGREVRRFVYEQVPPGVQQFVWDGKDEQGRSVASGVYLYRLNASGYSQTKKMLLVR